jgi:L-lactate dehydrogenase complex protein LldF
MSSRRRREEYRRLIRRAVHDTELQTALVRFTKAYREARDDAVRGIDFAALSEKLRAIKEDAIARLPELVDRFQREAEAVGCAVYRAATAQEARDYIGNLALARGVALVAKSKSMLTEEIGLNAHLERLGIEVVETDLGEWIIQLAGERPSHFTVPAIHKTREEVARLFSEKLGCDVHSDIPSLVKIARRELRQVFLEAGMGITGANIGIAETGTLVLVTNEGNGRLVTTLPPIHVALMGCEKIVPTLADATAILDLLSKSGTGQKATSYVSLITGPSRTSDIEKTLTIGVHGPEELHIILVDAGRSGIRDDPELRELLYCVKCGACLNVCPPFGSVGGHVFGGRTYAGGVGIALHAATDGDASVSEEMKLCSGCLTCLEYCPVTIDVPQILMDRKERAPALQRLPLRAMTRPNLFERIVKPATLGQLIFARQGRIRGGPLLGRVAGWRSLPALAKRPLRALERKRPRSPVANPRARLAIFAGCVIDYVYPHIGTAMIDSLRRLGYDAYFVEGQTCCGIPAAHLGDHETARELAAINVREILKGDPDYVITGCPTCCRALRHEFRTWGPPEAERVASITRDYSEFVTSFAQPDDARRQPADGMCVTYHDPCHALRGLGLRDEARRLIAAFGHRLIEMEEHDRCCGFAGDYSLRYPEVSRVILERKLDNIMTTGADAVASDCPGCILQISGGLDARTRRSAIPVLHTAEVVARGLR